MLIKIHVLMNVIYLILVNSSAKHSAAQKYFFSALRARPGFHPAFGRGHDGACGDGAWRSWLYISDIKRRAKTLRADAGGLPCRRFSGGLETA